MLYRIVLCISLGLSFFVLNSCVDRAGVEERLPVEEVLVVSDSLTFWSDVAPIAFENCTPCHSENGGAPFTLTAFKDFKKRTKTIRQVIADHIMPPWPADPTYSTFKDEKTLDELSRKIIVSWIDQGAVEGEFNADLKPKTLANKGFGEPDAIIYFPDTMFVTGDNLDKFVLAKIPFELPHDTILRAISFVPGNRQLVHHVNGHLINYVDAKKANPFAGEWEINAEGASSLSAYQRMKVYHDDGSYPAMLVSAFNYLPGVEPLDYPGDLGNVIINKKGAFILNTLHYGPTPKDTFDLSEIHLYYADKRPTRPLSELQLGTLGVTEITPEFIIPADSVCTFETRYTAPQDMSVLTINPHMHLLGRTFLSYAISPDLTDTIPLIRIKSWDFRWQYFYTFPQMVKIPSGYEIRVIATFDNTLNNPFNPNFPPIPVSESGIHMKTTDEMFQFFITYLPYREGDENNNL